MVAKRYRIVSPCRSLLGTAQTIEQCREFIADFDKYIAIDDKEGIKYPYIAFYNGSDLDKAGYRYLAFNNAKAWLDKQPEIIREEEAE